MTEANTKLKPNGWKMCRACRSEAQRRDSQKNRERRSRYHKNWSEQNRERVSEYKKAGYQKIREMIDSYKRDKPCTDCGQVFPPCVMDFDHVRGTKKFNVGLAKNLTQLAQEIEKCELVCANCHRIRTFTRSRS